VEGTVEEAQMNTRALICTAALAWLAIGSPAAAQDPDAQDTGRYDSRESYSYVSVLDGDATLAHEGSGPGEAAQLNEPLLTGDRIRLARDARLEIALADHNLLRIGGGSSLVLAKVAFSGDRGDRTTEIDLEEGEILLVVDSSALGDSLPEVRTPTADVVIHEPGSYRIEVSANDWTEVVVRTGYAEVVTDRGSTIVRTDESAFLQGDRWGTVDIAAAGGTDDLERWCDSLDRAAAASAQDQVVHVEPQLAYRAASMTGYGSWVDVDSTWYWQPRVDVGWSPYWRGRWDWTPSGLTWVSFEPWGWVPYHYGTWCLIPGYGWVWRPGNVYAPAWVYWHWGADWVGWCPTGYYTHWYGDRWGHGGFRFGVYGWSSGLWGFYGNWNFVPTHCLRERDPRRWQRHGRDLEHELGGRVPRGVLTTDTRGLPHGTFDRPGVGEALFLKRVRRDAEGGVPDLTDFVARKRDLPASVTRALTPDAGARIRLADVPIVATTDRPSRVFGDRGAVKTGRDLPTAVGGPARPDIGTGRDVAARQPLSPTGTARTTGDAPRAGTGVTDRPRRLVPGDTFEIDSSGRILPRTGTPSAVAPGAPARPAIDSGDRQGWRTREDWTGPRAAGSGVSGGPGSPGTQGLRRDEPVQRVLGGIRRSEPTTLPPGTDGVYVPPAAGTRWPAAGNAAPGRTDVPRWTPPATTLPSTPTPGARPGAVRPNWSPRSVTPPTTVRPATPPSAVRPVTPPSAVRPSSPPPSSVRSSPPPSSHAGSSSTPHGSGRSAPPSRSKQGEKH
jgi:hypothetical protein